ncbi:MAG: peptidase A2, partial [Paenibacillus sp. RIFOXYA1_FULL_44_5]
MENDKRDYSNFFDRSDRSENKEEQNDNKQVNSEQNPSYYSYGPYKSAMDETTAPSTRSSSEDSANDSVEISPPRPVKGFGFTVGNSQTPSKGTWEFRQKKSKGTSFRSMLSAFLAGALVVGTLMFASDKLNLFTSGQYASAPNVSTAAVAPAVVNSNNNGSSLSTASDIVRPNDIAQIVQNASPAVVKITSYVKADRLQNNSNNSLFNDPFFQQFFGDNGGSQSQQPQSTPNNNQNQYQELGLGSGFIFDKSGYILTNQHVVEGADEIKVSVEGYSQPFVAKLLGSDFNLDLAVLKIEGNNNFSVLKIGNSNQAEVGDWVIAIGNPYGFDHTVTVGVVSAKERPIDISDQGKVRKYEHLLQTDASINPGNSGGPLINLNGEVIGVNTAVSTQAQGIGFAIPSSTILANLENLKNNIKVPVPYIGI